MSDDSDYIQAMLLGGAPRPRKLSLWACVGIALVLIPLPLVLTWIL